MNIKSKCAEFHLLGRFPHVHLRDGTVTDYNLSQKRIDKEVRETMERTDRLFMKDDESKGLEILHRIVTFVQLIAGFSLIGIFIYIILSAVL